MGGIVLMHVSNNHLDCRADRATADGMTRRGRAGVPGSPMQKSEDGRHSSGCCWRGEADLLPSSSRPAIVGRWASFLYRPSPSFYASVEKRRRVGFSGNKCTARRAVVADDRQLARVEKNKSERHTRTNG